MTVFTMEVGGEQRRVKICRDRGDIVLVETMDGEPYGKHWFSRSVVDQAIEGAAGPDEAADEARAAVEEAVAGEQGGSEGEETGGEGEEEAQEAVSIEELESVQPSWYGGLRRAGYETAADVLEKGASGMTAVNGIGKSTAAKIYNEAEALD